MEIYHGKKQNDWVIMTNVKQSIFIEFLIGDVLSQGKRKVYKKPLEGAGSTVRVDNMPI